MSLTSPFGHLRHQRACAAVIYCRNSTHAVHTLEHMLTGKNFAQNQNF
jgi:hypothetical protein